MSDAPSHNAVPGDRQRRLTVFGSGAAAGIVAFLLGYLATWITAGVRAASVTTTGPFGSSVPRWRAVLWLFHDAHFVGTRTPRVIGPDGSLWSSGALVDTVGLLGVEYVYLVPPLALLVAGAAVSLWLRRGTPRAGLQAGMTVTAGYLVAVVLSLFVASNAGIGPSPLRALVVAGVVYPVAFGGLGGLVGALLARRRAGERSTQAV